MKSPAVLETFQKYRSALWPVNCLISQDLHRRPGFGLSALGSSKIHQVKVFAKAWSLEPEA
jgi:hypothetical protein